MTHPTCQPAILEPNPRLAIFLTFGLRRADAARRVVGALRERAAGEGEIIGLGAPLVQAAGGDVPGLKAFPGIAGAGVAFPSTQGALFATLGGRDHGTVLDRARALAATLRPLALDSETWAFTYQDSRDLTGYVDGTENPKDEEAIEAAIVADGPAGLAGSSFFAEQRYVHRLDDFGALPKKEADHVIGRDRVSNEELDDAPETAHVKRTAQETYEPPAFMLRKSMPWGGVAEHGLQFLAYVESLDRFERVLRRMAGLEDGKLDRLMGFTRAITGGYYWCPPIAGGRLDLSLLGG